MVQHRDDTRANNKKKKKKEQTWNFKHGGHIMLATRLAVLADWLAR